MMSDENPTRRKFMKFLGVSGAGVAFATAVDASKEKIKAGGEDAKKEIEKLQEDFEQLDKKTQLILKIVLAVTGLNIFF